MNRNKRVTTKMPLATRLAYPDTAGSHRRMVVSTPTPVSTTPIKADDKHRLRRLRGRTIVCGHVSSPFVAVRAGRDPTRSLAGALRHPPFDVRVGPARRRINASHSCG